MSEEPTDPRLETAVVQSRYVGRRDAGRGGVVDAPFLLGLLLDAGTELCVRTDGDEGQLVGIAEMDFLFPVYAGDVVEARASMLRVGSTSRELGFEVRVLCRSANGTANRGGKRGRSETAAEVLEEPMVVVRARGTVVVGTP